MAQARRDDYHKIMRAFLAETDLEKKRALGAQIGKAFGVPPQVFDQFDAGDLDLMGAAYERQTRVNEAYAARKRGEDVPMVYGPPIDWAHDGTEVLRRDPSGKVLPPRAGYECSTCRDSGFVRRDVDIHHPDFGKALKCPDCPQTSAVRLERWQARRDRSGLPRGFYDATLESFRRVPGDTDAWAAVQEFLDAVRRGGAPNWLALFGATGRGKTHLLAAITQALLPTHDVRWLDAPEFIAACKADQFALEAELTRVATDAAVLVIDEMGSFQDSEWSRVKFEAVLNARYERGLPTAIALTIDFAAFGIWSPRLASRLSDGGICLAAVLACDDYRLKKRPA